VVNETRPKAADASEIEGDHGREGTLTLPAVHCLGCHERHQPLDLYDPSWHQWLLSLYPLNYLFLFLPFAQVSRLQKG